MDRLRIRSAFKRRVRLATAALGLVVSCSNPPPYVVPADHPGNPNAAGAPLPQFADLRTTRPELAGAPAAADHAVADDGLYHCPMHPKIAQKDPGSCPLCGMALEKAPPPKSHAEHQR